MEHYPLETIVPYTPDFPGNEEDGSYIIYLVTNKMNNKKYFGQTRRLLQKRWKGHIKDALSDTRKKFYFQEAIRKHGPSNFDICEVYRCQSQEDADMMERFFIFISDSHKPEYGYNLSLGGSGIDPNEATKKKQRDIRKNLKHPMLGRNHSEEAKQKMREGQAKRGPRSAKHRENIGKALKKFHDENPGYHASCMKTGPEHHNFGKKASAETRQKQSDSHRKRQSSE